MAEHSQQFIHANPSAIHTGLPALRWWFYRGGRWWFRWSIRLIILVIIGAIGCLPYRHDVGGDCRLVPLAERGIRAQIDDEIRQVHVREGDRVEQGQVIATLSVREHRAAAAKAMAELEKARANLDLLENGSRPEVIAIAEQKAEMARVQLEFSQSEVARLESLVSKTAAAKKDLEKARKEYDLAKRGVVATQENYERVKSGSREEEIRAAAADVSRLEAELAYRKELIALGTITTPIAGRVVTANVREREGSYVREGDLIAVIHDDRGIRAEIAADETAAVLVEAGMAVEIRLNGMDGRLLKGYVEQISPSLIDGTEFNVDRIRTDRESWTHESIQGSSDRHARIYVRIEAYDVPLRAGMTGYARVAVGTGRLWDALARPTLRFLRVEVWSWLP